VIRELFAKTKDSFAVWAFMPGKCGQTVLIENVNLYGLKQAGSPAAISREEWCKTIKYGIRHQRHKASNDVAETPVNLRGTGETISPREPFCPSLVARGSGAGDV